MMGKEPVKEPMEERKEEEPKQPGKEEAPLRDEKPIRIEPVRLRSKERPSQPEVKVEKSPPPKPKVSPPGPVSEANIEAPRISIEGLMKKETHPGKEVKETAIPAVVPSAGRLQTVLLFVALIFLLATMFVLLSGLGGELPGFLKGVLDLFHATT